MSFFGRSRRGGGFVGIQVYGADLSGDRHWKDWTAMDNRKELIKNDRLVFPGMECVIDSLAGRGASVLAYVGHYQDGQNPNLFHQILIRELFPYDEDGGIYRRADGSIVVEEKSRELYNHHRTYFLRDNEIHVRLSRKHPEDMDLNINTFEHRGTLYSLIGYSGGCSLEEMLPFFHPDSNADNGHSCSGLSGREELPSFPFASDPLRRILRIIAGALDQLEAFHEAGYLHLDISPDNILLIGGGYVPQHAAASRYVGSDAKSMYLKEGGRVPQHFAEQRYIGSDEKSIHLWDDKSAPRHSAVSQYVGPDENSMHPWGGKKERVVLIDYNSALTLEEVREQKNAHYSKKEGYTAPEVAMGAGGDNIGFWTDLYSLTAVFYQCISGNKLTQMQLIGAEPPVPFFSSINMLEGCPETALSLLRHIFLKGLSVVPKRRYRTAGQLREDLVELEARMDGRGITRWALWETGRARVMRMLRENTAFHYILDDEALYPLYARDKGGKKIPLLAGSLQTDFLNGGGTAVHDGVPATVPDPDVSSGGGRGGGRRGEENEYVEGARSRRPPVLLLGAGGMGKTTAMLRIAGRQVARYRPESSVACYASLYGYASGSRTYIRDRLLEGLKFAPGTDSVEDARRELAEVFNKPSGGRNAPFLLLIDGLNEAAGDISFLLEEIHFLASLAGVQVVLSSRSDPGDPGFEKLELCRLDQEDVRAILSREGILPPESMETFDLLRFPLLLSMFLSAAKNRPRMISTESREELLERYFASILEKEEGNHSGKREHSMGVEAAVLYVLPEIAALIHEKNRSIADGEILPVVEKCYRRLSDRSLTKIRPGWIGRTKELRAGATDADEWYGVIVREILWKRLGLLVRDEEGRFRIPHQILEDYLVEKSMKFHEVFEQEWKRQRNWGFMAAMALAVFVLSALCAYNYSVGRKIMQKHEAMVAAEKKQTVSEYIGESERRLESGDRKGAVRYAAEALLLEYADFSQTEQLLEYAMQDEPFPEPLRKVVMDRIAEGDGKGKKARADELSTRKQTGDEGWSGEHAGNIPMSDEISTSKQTGAAGTSGEYVGTIPLSEEKKAWGAASADLSGTTVKERKAGEQDSNAAKAQKALTDALGIYDLEDSFTSAYILDLPTQPLKMRLSPEGTRILAICAWEVLVYDAEDGREILSRPVPATALSEAEFLDEDRIVYTSPEGVCAFDMENGSALWTAPAALELAVSEDGSTVAALSQGGPGEDATVRIYDASDGELLHTIVFSGKRQKEGYNPVRIDRENDILSLNGDGRFLAASFEDGSLYACDLERGKTSRILEASGYSHFQGGFADDVFVFCAESDDNCLLSVRELSSWKTLYNEVNDYPYILQADGEGIFFSLENSVYFYDPRWSISDEWEDDDPVVIARAGADLTSFHFSQNYLAAGAEDQQFSLLSLDSEKSASYNMEFECVFSALSGETALAGGIDAASIHVFRKNDRSDREILSYDPGCPHSEARLSEDGGTAMLFNSVEYTVYSLTGEDVVAEEALPNSEEVYDTQFRRQNGESWLEVTWYDGTVRDYSARDGSLLSLEQGTPPDRSLAQEFFTDHYRITTLPQNPIAVYNRETGEKLLELDEDANPAYVDQVGEYIIMQYFTTLRGTRYAFLLNDSFETLAVLPYLCDVVGDELIFDCPSGSLRSNPIYSLPMLLELAGEL